MIYVDMDSTIVDFEKGYYDLTGINLKGQFIEFGPKEWEPINQAGISWWAGLDWMPDGKQLWEYIKKYRPMLLSKPSQNITSSIGKKQWCNIHLPRIKLILTQDKSKYCRKGDILIDDLKENIDAWNKKNGLGILHTSTKNTINELKKYDK